MLEEHQHFILADHVIRKIAENIKLINVRNRLISEQINSECQEVEIQDGFSQAHYSTTAASDPHYFVNSVDNSGKTPNNRGIGNSIKGIGNALNRATTNFPSMSQIGNVIDHGSKLLENPNAPVGSVANLALKAVAATSYGKTGMEAFKLAKTLHEVYKDPKKAAAGKLREQFIGLGTNAILSAMGPAGTVIQHLQGPVGGMLQQHLLKGPVGEFAAAQAKKVFAEQVEKMPGGKMLKQGFEIFGNKN